MTSTLKRARLRLPPAQPLLELNRRDLAWAALVGAASAVLFATTLTGHTYLGDGPETVAGVSSLGILHAPGYPTYVLAAHLFTLLVPVGDEAFRVNLFSLLCASLTVSGVALLARRCGAARWAASIGALALAASAGFWFYSGFAKHDMFSGLLLTITLHLALAWRARPTTGRLVALAAVVGLALGSSWPLEVTVLPMVAFVLFSSRRQLSVRSLACATATGLVVLVAMYGFVMVRAGENPPVNWGGATTISRLVDLVNRRDFTAHGSSAQASLAGSVATNTQSSARLPVPIYVPFIFGRELGALAALIAVLGSVASLTWRRGAASYPLLIAFLANLAAANAVVGFGNRPGGFGADLVEEGFVLGCYFVLACWVSIGAAELLAIAGRAPISERLSGRLRRPLAAIARARHSGPAAAVAIGAAVVVPLVLGNWTVVHRSSKPFADTYAQAVFSELPPHAAVFMFGAELTQPLIYRQLVDHQRPDVVVIAADGLSYGWYRQQLSRRLGIRLPSITGNSFADAAHTISSVARVRPVYLDPQAAEAVTNVLGYRPVGLMSALASGHGQAYVSAPSDVERRLLDDERQAGFPDHNWAVWPNDYISEAEYATAALHVARAYYQHHDVTGTRRALLNTLEIEPGDEIAENDLAALNTLGSG